jgi:hypothetical protein
LYITEIALCAGTRCNIQNIKLRKEENGRGREEKPLEVQSCKQKVVKKIPSERGIFASSMQNRQLDCLKRIQ